MRRGALLLLGAVATAIALLGIDVARIAGQIDRVTVRLPDDQPGTTWLLVGSDTRDTEVPDDYQFAFEMVPSVAGGRADVVLLLHREAGRAAIVAIPRDVLVENEEGRLRRLSLLLPEGLQSMVDAVCSSIGVAVDHVAVLDAGGLAGIVDVIGPIHLELEHPLRDRDTALFLTETGDVALDGTDVLALVRSRHGEELVDGTWEPVSDGATERAEHAVDVLAALRTEVGAVGMDPIALHRLAGVAAAHLQVDDGGSLADLLAVGRSGGSAALSVLPSTPLDGTIAATLDPDAPDVLAAAGMATGCRVAADEAEI